MRNSSNKAVSFTARDNASWLSLSQTSGQVPGDSSRRIRLTASRAGLAPGTYSAAVAIDAGAGGTAKVRVTMTVVEASEPALDVSPEQVDFGSSDTTETVALVNTADSSLTWTASENSSWLSLNSTSGTIAADSKKGLKLYAERDGLAAGTYSAKVNISDGTGSAETVTVSMTVPSSSSVALEGQVIDQFGGSGKGGLTVEFDGKKATTDGSGRFSIAGSSSSTLRALTVSGSGIYTRGTFARTGDSQWRVVPSSFNVKGFNDMAREVSAGTIRWAAAPQIYIDARPEGFSGGPEFDLWLAEVEAHAPAFFSKWTGHQMSAASVKVGTSPPADFTAGTIVVHFSEKSSRYGDKPNVFGRAWTSSRSDNSIASATIWLRFKISGGESGAAFRQAIFAHELGHTIGLAHMDASITSLMSPQVSVIDLSSFDGLVASLLYSRSPGNTSHDNDSAGSHTASLALARAPVTEEWICGVAPHLVPGEGPATAP